MQYVQRVKKLMGVVIIQDKTAVGVWGSRIMDMDHIHVLLKDKLPSWWKKGERICDWCIYSLMKAGVVSENIEGNIDMLGVCIKGRCPYADLD